MKWRSMPRGQAVTCGNWRETMKASCRSYPDQVLFGDSHFHTNLSFDAGLYGTKLDVDAGYRRRRHNWLSAWDG